MSPLRDIDALLRARGRFVPDASRAPVRSLAGIILVCGGCCGAILGAHGGLGPQMLLSAIKVPLLIGISTLLALPSLFVINTVAGLRADLPAVLKGIFVSQATVAIALSALGPLLLLVYASTANYQVAKLASGLLFLAASLAGQRTLASHYGPLLRGDVRHRMGRRLWWFLYVPITIQLAWLLRPFIGSPDMPLQLWREEAWGNAFVELAQLLQRVWAGQTWRP